MQREQNHRRTTAWISHFVDYLDTSILPLLPLQFGNEYSAGMERETGDPLLSRRLDVHMVYDLARQLGLPIADLDEEKPANVKLHLPAPLIPFSFRCPQCGQTLKRPSHGHTHSIWLYESSGAHFVPELFAECTNRACKTLVRSDRYTRDRNNEGERDVYALEADALCIGRGRYASRELAIGLSTAVANAHVPLSTFATCWNVSQSHRHERLDHRDLPAVNCPPALSHTNCWRLFVLHHALLFTDPHGDFYIPSNLEYRRPGALEMDPEILTEHDDIMVVAALRIFPSRLVNGSHFVTYLVPGMSEHTCSECAHFHRSFPAGHAIGPNSTQDELEAAHRAVETDRRRVAKAAVIDGIEKIGHKVSNLLFIHDCMSC